MANFTNFNSLCFPSPSVTRHPVNTSTPTSSEYLKPSLSSGLPSSCTLSVCSTAIQFPSPIYTSSGILPTMNTGYSQQRINLLPRHYALEPGNPSLIKLCQGNNVSTDPNILGNGWQYSVPSTMPWAVSGQRQNVMHFSASDPSTQTSLVNR